MGNDFIKAYEKLRPVLRDLYLYGCFGRGDFPQRQRQAFFKPGLRQGQPLGSHGVELKAGAGCCLVGQA